MIYSVLFFVVAIRAIVRSVQDKFTFGIAAGGARLALAILGAYLALSQSAVIMVPGLVVHTGGADISLLGALGSLGTTIVGPILSAALLYVAWKRYQDVPAADEARLERAFGAWLPVGILDGISVVVFIGTLLLSSGP